MLDPGTKAPELVLGDHLGREIRLSDFAGKQHVLIAFYPLDFTPT